MKTKPKAEAAPAQVGTKRECPHCGGSLTRYEDPLVVTLINKLEERNRALVEALKSCPALGFGNAILNEWWKNIAKPALALAESERE